MSLPELAFDPVIHPPARLQITAVLAAVQEAEFALLISDAWQHQGIGAELLKRLVHIGRDEKLSRITAEILGDNQPMLHVTKKAGFKLMQDPGSNDFTAEHKL